MKPTTSLFIKGQPEIRALEISPADGKVIVAAFETGEIHIYEGLVPFDAKTPLKFLEIGTVGQPKTRCIQYWKSRDEIVVGCEMGRFAVYSMSNLSQGPIRKNLSKEANNSRFFEATR